MNGKKHTSQIYTTTVTHKCHKATEHLIKQKKRTNNYANFMLKMLIYSTSECSKYCHCLF